MSSGRRILLLAGMVTVAALGPLAAPAAAHPLGNFTTNTFAGLHVTPDAVTVDYVIDLAEIPTLRARGDMDADGDDAISPAETAAWGRRQCDGLGPRLHVRLDGVSTALGLRRATASLTDGEAGLSTTRVECGFAAEADLRTVTRVAFRDTAFAARIGWREVTVDARGIAITDSDVPATSVSNRLTDYPQDRPAPLDQRTASLRLGTGTRIGGFARSAGAPDAVVGEVDRLTAMFTGLVSRPQLTAGFALIAMLVATALGALHALAPGHGKTVMAAYLVGDRGTGRQALGLGVTVAVTHTVGVLLLGVGLSASQALTPERLYPWLGAVSGVLFCAVGVLLLRRSVGGGSHGHTHGDLAHSDGSHAHGDGSGDHGHDGHQHERAFVHADRAQQVTWRTLALPGLAGGMVPSPSALLVLLGGIALGRAWFGVALVVGYGVGMAATLIAAGYLAVRVRDRIGRRRDRPMRPALAWPLHRLPRISAVLVIVGGLIITARSLVVI